MEFKLPVSRGSIAIATNPSALLDLPDNNDDLLTYLRDLARAKGGNGDITLTVDGFKAAGLHSLQQMNPFSFDLIRSPNGKDFVGALSAMTFEFSCDDSSNCKFAIFSNGVGNANVAGFLGVLVSQNQSSNPMELSLTCRGQQCLITGVENGRNESRTLKNNETATFSSLAKSRGQ